MRCEICDQKPMNCDCGDAAIRSNDELNEALEAIDQLQAFKDYVHGRLDAAGVPEDPNREQTKATGCRIGGRLDWLIRWAGLNAGAPNE